MSVNNRSDHEKKIIWCRATLQKFDKQLRPPSTPLSSEDLVVLKRVLNFLSQCRQSSEQTLQRWQVPRVLRRLLTHAQILPDSFPPLIEMQLAAWERGEYNLAMGSADEVDDDSAKTSSSEEEENIQPLRGSAMRGISRVRSKSGKMWVYKIDKSYQRPANRFGPNQLEVGAWWPLQICALRDGAHGSHRSGIYGKKEKGAYSIIISGGTGYDDLDLGDVVWYTGSGSKGEDQTLGIGNQALITSFNTKLPVRVLRRSKSSSKFAPSQGLRYDGIYVVTDHKAVVGRDGHRVFKYKLERCPNQREIQLKVPGRAELKTLHD